MNWNSKFEMHQSSDKISPPEVILRTVVCFDKFLQNVYILGKSKYIRNIW